ncbi:EF-hand_domain-containing protein [Hexamita inflata]|uniref:EF-hand_domain-containing protein n=1 Tax=Hexamita inflata TaxID=28002 RepID=A0ABP1GZ81_9EUKA
MAISRIQCANLQFSGQIANSAPNSRTQPQRCFSSQDFCVTLWLYPRYIRRCFQKSLTSVIPDIQHFSGRLLSTPSIQMQQGNNCCQEKKECCEKAKATFEMIDANKDGFVSFQELITFMEQSECKGKDCCKEQAKAAFDKFDADHNGLLDFKEFCEMMKEIHHQKEQQCCQEKKECCQKK